MRDKGVLISACAMGHNVLKIRPPMPFSKEDAAFLITMLKKILMEDF